MTDLVRGEAVDGQANLAVIMLLPLMVSLVLK